jgi:hypothetical protein
MSIRDLYIGGPASANVGRDFFPSVPFNAADPAMLALTPAAHKGPSEFGLTRVLSLVPDLTTSDGSAIKSYFAAQTAAGTPLAVGDVLGLILLPPNVLFKALHVAVEGAVTGLTLTPSTRVGGLTFPAIDCAALIPGQICAPGDAAWVTDGPLLGNPTYNAAPDILQLTVTALPAGGLNGLRLRMTPLVSNFDHGEH